MKKINQLYIHWVRILEWAALSPTFLENVFLSNTYFLSKFKFELFFFYNYEETNWLMVTPFEIKFQVSFHFDYNNYTIF